VLYPEAQRTPFRALIRKARQDSVMPGNIADLADAGAELRNSFSHPLTQATLTLGMAVPMLENTHRLVALVMTAAAERDPAWEQGHRVTRARPPGDGTDGGMPIRRASRTAVPAARTARTRQ
jgi:hypothetical protein